MQDSALNLAAPTEIFTNSLSRGDRTPSFAPAKTSLGEVEALIEVAKSQSTRPSGRTMILIAFRNGPACAELCDLRWEQIDFGGALLHVRRVKNGRLAARHNVPAIFVRDTALNLTGIP